MKPYDVQIVPDDSKYIFGSLPGCHLLILPDKPAFTIAAASNDLLTWQKKSPDPFIAKGILDVFEQAFSLQKEDAESIYQLLEQAITDKSTAYFSFENSVSSNKKQPNHSLCRISVKPVVNKENEVLYLFLTLEVGNSIASSNVQNEKPKNLEKTLGLFLHAPMSVFLLYGAENRIEFANEEALKWWGKGKEIIGKRYVQVDPAIKQLEVPELLEKVRKTGEPYIAKEAAFSALADGNEKVYYFDRIYQPYFEKGLQTATGVLVLSYDITDLVTAKKRIEESENKYHSLFDTMDQGFCILEVIFDDNNRPIDYHFIETNPVFERQTGLKAAIGKTARELVPNLESHWFELYGKVALTGEALHFSQGSEAMGRFFDVYAFKMGDATSKRVALLFTDISEQRKSEEALRQSEQNLRNMILQAPVAMAVLKGSSFVVQIANDRMYELWGRDKEQILDKSIFEALPEVKGQGYEELLRGVYTTGKTFSAEGIPVQVPREKGMETIYINLLYEPFLSGDGTITGIMVVANDVTEQVKARKKMEESEWELQQKVKERTHELENQTRLVNNILDNSSNGISVTEMIRDEKGNVIDASTILANEAAIRYTGLPREIYLTKTAKEIDPFILESDYGKTCLHTLETGEPALIQYHLQMVNKWLELTISRMDKDHLIHIFTDVTPIKESQLQLERTIEELKRSNSNLEEFAYAASHDLKEPIRKVHFFSDRLRSELSDSLSENQRRLFERMQYAANRMGTLIDDLLTYSHFTKEISQLEPIDLNQKIRTVLGDLELEIEEKKAQITVGEMPVINGNRRQLQQLFQNLVGNALKYAKPGLPPEVQISASKVKGKEAGTDSPTIDAEKWYYLIEVKDNGIGFKQEDAQRIFNVFTRLHGNAEYGGSGVGLSIVKKVAENHNGYVWAEAQVESGALFKVLLPA